MSDDGNGITASRPLSRSGDTAIVVQEGIVAGLIGAATIAIWFLILDSISGRPLYTPTVLGTALFRRSELAAAEPLPISRDMVLMFTWVHALVFATVGGVVSWLLAIAERNPNVGFGILFLFIVCESGFVAAAFVLAEPVLHALAWPAILVANLLAATTMTAYFRLRHPRLKIAP